MAVTNLTGSNQAVRAGSGVYRGFAVRETSGSATALVRVFDNASAASGSLIDEISLAANESAREYYAGGGVIVYNGIFVQVVSGAVTGSVRAD